MGRHCRTRAKVVGNLMARMLYVPQQFTRRAACLSGNAKAPSFRSYLLRRAAYATILVRSP